MFFSWYPEDTGYPIPAQLWFSTKCNFRWIKIPQRQWTSFKSLFTVQLRIISYKSLVTIPQLQIDSYQVQFTSYYVPQLQIDCYKSPLTNHNTSSKQQTRQQKWGHTYGSHTTANKQISNVNPKTFSLKEFERTFRFETRLMDHTIRM